MSFSTPARDRLLSPNELVRRWEQSFYPVSAVTLGRWRRNGTGPAFHKIGAAGRIFYSLDSVVAFESTLNLNPNG